ncbi:related to DNA2 - DNA helicase [Ustilago trichophora]|uniref:DNA replication ATP-dependent helicase/nuclease DNA2 n=1 Tax=Ustilago trichophora TaxID=86804 RepID=A0A5C3E1L6_9BASI|nr:related to DNA2 - DNA helicase [Ustilago trichophora]
MTLDAADALFMDELFADLDASHFSIPPSQSPPKKKPARLPRSSQQHNASPTSGSNASRSRSPLKDSTRFQSQPAIDHDLEDWYRPALAQPTSSNRRIVSASGIKRQKIEHIDDFPRQSASAAKQITSSSIERTASVCKQPQEQCNYVRCRVLAVIESSYEVAVDGPSMSTRTRPEKLLVLETDKHNKKVTQASPRKRLSNAASVDEQVETLLASLRDDWMHTMISVGNIVHLVGQYEDAMVKIPVLLDQQSKQGSAPTRTSELTSRVEVAIEQPIDKRLDANGADCPDDEDDDLWDDLASMPSLSQCATQELLASDDAPKAKIMIFSSRSATSKGSENTDHALDNLLVVHPDVLVPATKVADVASCIRKPVVQDRLRGASDMSISLVMGNMLHELLQACLTASSPAQTSQDSLIGVHSGEEAKPAATFSSPWPAQWQGIGNFSKAFVESQVEEQVRTNIESLYAIDLSAEEAAVQLREKAAPFAHFARTFLLREDDATFHPEATLREPGRATTSAQAKVRLRRILDVEEEIWSPIFGLKGKVDVSVECDILEVSESPKAKAASGHSRQAFSRGDQKMAAAEQNQHLFTSSVVPLELKTGRAEVVSTEHRAQTMLYTLMMSDRYGVRVGDGLLYYSKSGELHRISRSRNEVRSLIIGRNELAHYLRHDTSRLQKSKGGEPAEEVAQVLPPTIDSEHKCRRCYAVDGCMLFRRAVENVVEPSEAIVDDIEGSITPKFGNMLSKRSPIADVYEQKTEHLSDVHLDFFRKWDRLLNLEEEDAVRFRREMWTMTAEQREKVGRCFGNMRLDVLPGTSSHGPSSSMRRVVHRFVRHHDPTQDAEAGLLSGHITVNDPVTISIEPGMLSVAQGFVAKLTPTAVEIGLDHSPDAAMRRALERSNGAQEESFNIAAAAERIVFRIDKDELGSGMGRVRANLAALFLAQQKGGDVKRRELIVDRRRPRFLPSEQLEEALAVGSETRPVGEIIAQVHADASVNEDQKLAIDKVLSAQDYALVLGMPGTGKTTTIAKLIELLVKLGKRILLTSYTHSAVDTILRKLAEDRVKKEDGEEDDMRILRLGSKDKVHPDAQQFLLPRCTTLEELKKAFETPNVVAATCLSVHHTFFTSGVAKKFRSRTSADEGTSSAYLFDYCIVDEASQIPLPTCLGPLRFADKFVLVGDHHQLPPLVKNPEAKAGGLDVSLFKLLSDQHGKEAMVALRSQYRMNDDIMRLSNELVYEGQLRAGSKSVRDRTLILPDLQAALNFAAADPWMKELLHPESKVRFLDTSKRALAEAGESKHGDLVKNQFEAELVVRIASALIAGGCDASQIAVVTPYRQQIKLLRSLLLQHSLTQKGRVVEGLDQIELLTADQSQGRDKDVILVTLTRANYSPLSTSNTDADKGGNTGELLTDLRRLNVTLTRAKKKLVMVGHSATLESSTVVRPLLGLVRGQGWVREI